MSVDRRDLIRIPFDQLKAVISKISDSQASNPTWGDISISRRGVLQSGLMLAGLTAAACTTPNVEPKAQPAQSTIGPAAPPTSPRPNATEVARGVEYVAPELKRLGQELANWTLADGNKMVNIYPEVKKTSDLLQGLVDPRSYIPVIRVPVQFSNNTDIGEFSIINVLTNPQDPRKVVINRRGSKASESEWAPESSSPSHLAFSKDVMASSVKGVVATKEVDQVINYIKCCRAAIAEASKKGVNVIIQNSTNLPSSEALNLFNQAYSLRALELKANPNEMPYLDLLVEFSSAIAIGPIFGTWLLDQGYRGIKNPNPLPLWWDTSIDITGFLQDQKLVTQERTFFRWTKGQPPQIGTTEFDQLLKAYTGRSGSSF